MNNDTKIPRTLGELFRTQKRDLFKDPHLLYSLLLGLITVLTLCFYSFKWDPIDIPIRPLAELMLTYSSIALGVTLTISALVFSLLPSAQTELWEKREESILDLLLVLTWANISHLSLIIFSVFSYIFAGNSILIPLTFHLSHYFFLFLGVSVAYYSIFHLYASIETMYQFSAVWLAYTRKASEVSTKPTADSP